MGAKGFLSSLGKSGHISRKIVSPFLTGASACFLHLTDPIRYAQNVGIPLIAVTSFTNSILSFSSDIVLLIPQESKIRPLGLAPTPTIISMLVLGDAMAICLSQLKGFEQRNYRLRHPSGSLGRQLLKICDIMRSQEQLHLVCSEELVGQGLLITQKTCGYLRVLDKNTSDQVIGVVTDGDLWRNMTSNLLEKKVTL